MTNFINATRQTVMHLSYTPYGYSLGFLALGWNGFYRDPTTGMYNLGNGYRAYSPVSMRFASPDSWSPFARGGLNPYMYCAGDPINRADPSGHMYHHGTGKSFPGLHEMARLPNPKRAVSPTPTSSRSSISGPPRKKTAFPSNFPTVVTERAGSKMTANQSVNQMIKNFEKEAWSAYHPPQMPTDAEITARQFVMMGGALEDRGLINASHIAFGYAQSQSANVLNQYGVPPELQRQILTTWSSNPDRTSADVHRILAKEIRIQLPSRADFQY